MGKYLYDCEVLEMKLEVPGEDVRELVDWFDGSHGAERASAKAELAGRELRIEAQGGRVLLTLRGEAFVPEEIEILDDREALFFESVVLALFVTYQGTLRCRVRWAGHRHGSVGDEQEVQVDQGRSSWPNPVTPGAWLVASAISEVGAEIRGKLEEARRHYDEYLRLKEQRGMSKR
ncbi:MAG TPA: hypothetical protein DFS52_20800 [Myxococcales bacterium]|jgi:hypothetical protein|nr:hypothetical protein [Myxococcales bacterium]